MWVSSWSKLLLLQSWEVASLEPVKNSGLCPQKTFSIPTLAMFEHALNSGEMRLPFEISSQTSLMSSIPLLRECLLEEITPLETSLPAVCQRTAKKILHSMEVIIISTAFKCDQIVLFRDAKLKYAGLSVPYLKWKPWLLWLWWWPCLLGLMFRRSQFDWAPPKRSFRLRGEIEAKKLCSRIWLIPRTSCDNYLARQVDFPKSALGRFSVQSTFLARVSVSSCSCLCFVALTSSISGVQPLPKDTSILSNLLWEAFQVSLFKAYESIHEVLLIPIRLGIGCLLTAHILRNPSQE